MDHLVGVFVSIVLLRGTAARTFQWWRLQIKDIQYHDYKNIKSLKDGLTPVNPR